MEMSSLGVSADKVVDLEPDAESPPALAEHSFPTPAAPKHYSPKSNAWMKPELVAEHAENLAKMSPSDRAMVGKLAAEVEQRNKRLFDELGVPLPERVTGGFVLQEIKGALGHVVPVQPERTGINGNHYIAVDHNKLVEETDSGERRYAWNWITRTLSHESWHLISGPRIVRNFEQNTAEQICGFYMNCYDNGRGFSLGSKLEEASTELLSSLSVRLHKAPDEPVFEDTWGSRYYFTSYLFECEKLMQMADLIEPDRRKEFFAGLLRAKTFQDDSKNAKELFHERIQMFTNNFNELTDNGYNLNGIEFVQAFETMEMAAYSAWLKSGEAPVPVTATPAGGWVKKLQTLIDNIGKRLS